MGGLKRTKQGKKVACYSVFPRGSLAAAPAELREPPGWRLCPRGHRQAGAASLQWPGTSQAQPRWPVAYGRRQTHLPSPEAMERARLAGTQMRGGGDAPWDTGERWRKQERGLPKRGCGAQKEATQPFPEKRKRRRRGKRGGRECQLLEVVARGLGAGVLGRAQPEGERQGGPRRSPQRRRGGALLSWLPVLQTSCCQVPAPSLSPRLVAWKGAVTPLSFWGGRGHPTLARVWRPRRHK